MKNYNNFTEIFMEKVKSVPEKVILRYKKDEKWQDVTWQDYYDTSSKIASGLIALGMNSNDVVNIFSNSRVEWAFADMAIMLAGGVDVAIYQSNTPDEAEYIISNSEGKFLFCEDESILNKAMQVKDKLVNIKKIILMTGKKSVNDDSVITLEELMKLGKENFDEKKLEERWKGKTRDDVLTLIYTSGTTGVPKGAVLTHGNVIAEIDGIDGLVNVEEGDVSVMFLPLAHVFARAVYWYGIYVGYINAFAESIDKLLENIQEMRPHFMGSVPRIYEKVYAKITGEVEQAGGLKKVIFNWAISVGKEVSKRKEYKQPITGFLNFKYKIAQKLVFSKLNQAFGGRLKFFLSSGAPLAKQIAQFFHSADIFIMEVWGMTELSGGGTSNTFDDFRFGSIGKELSNTKVKIAEDGELLIKGPIVMKEYYKMPDETAETIDKDGWLHTGDIGKIDEEGFIYIVDRKKDLIITSGGKNIAPQMIENMIKTDRFINQIIVVGDARKYLAALVTLSYDDVEPYAKENGISFSSQEDLIKNDKIKELIMSRIEEYNSKLASYETIKKITLMPGEFTQETGELTPTLKVRRKIVNEKYKDIIDSMYDN